MSIKPYVEMVRVPNSLLSGVAALLAVLVYSGYELKLVLLACAFVTGFSLTAAVMLVNDVVDSAVDLVNKPWKPIPSGRASPRVALVLAAVFFALGVLCNLAASLLLLLVAAVYGAVGVLYNYMRKKWWSSNLVALSTTGPVVYGYAACGFPESSALFTALFAITMYTVTLGREVLKSIQDYRGDLEAGYSTVATKYGLSKAYTAMLAIGLAGSALGLLTATLGSVSTAYRILILLAAAVYAYSIVVAYKLRDTRVLEASRKRTLLAMAIGVAAFWTSALKI